MQQCSKGVLRGGIQVQLGHSPKSGGVVSGLPVQMQSVLFSDVSLQDWLKEITVFETSLREKCSLLVHPILGTGNKM